MSSYKHWNCWTKIGMNLGTKIISKSILKYNTQDKHMREVSVFSIDVLIGIRKNPFLIR